MKMQLDSWWGEWFLLPTIHINIGNRELDFTWLNWSIVFTFRGEVR